MEMLIEQISRPWPWYVAGPLIGLVVPLMLVAGNRALGVSSSFRHVCAACFPANIPFLKYNWKSEIWNLLFVLGIALGGYIAVYAIGHPDIIAVSGQTVADLQQMGISYNAGTLPANIFSVESLLSARGLLFIVVGGFLVGFGTRYAGGCTSGHAISGLSNLQWPSLVAVVGFFAGGLFTTHIVFPLIF